ncbi:MAG: hypothetical protein EXQ77_00625 [Thermoleophilia bacterium]|nr:hypothetical protein [Thermoleophilia bacterium]
MAPRAPLLHAALRGFTLGAFARLARELEAKQGTLPFLFEEHGGQRGPALYEYRPLVRGFVEEHAAFLRETPDADLALAELEREPAAAVFAHAHAGRSGREALYRAVCLDLLIRVAEACGGLDWHDDAFDHAYAGLEESLFGEHRAYCAVAPLVGLEGFSTCELGGGVRVRVVAEGEVTRHWPETRTLLPAGFGREPDRCLVLELRRVLDAGEAAPDAPAEVADAVSAIRLATAAPLAAGPVVLETLDGRPFGVRPVLPIAASAPAGEAGRLDEFRGARAARLLAALATAEADAPLAEALDRWELALFQTEPVRSEQLRAALAALLGATWPRRAAALIESDAATAPTADTVRQALVAVLERGDRLSLLRHLDAACDDVTKSAQSGHTAGTTPALTWSHGGGADAYRAARPDRHHAPGGRGTGRAAR